MAKNRLKNYGGLQFVWCGLMCLLFALSCSQENQHWENGKSSADVISNIANEVIGPLEIPRTDISTKYGWDGSIWLKPLENYKLELVRGMGIVKYDLCNFPEGMNVPRLESVGDGCEFSGSNIQIGNLVFEGSFTWSDKKITLEKGSKIRMVESN